MSQGIRRYFLLLVLVFLTIAGCRSTDTRPQVDLDHLISSRHFRFADGGSAIFYTLDKSLSTSSPQRFDTLMFVIGGSGCDSMQYFLPHYFRGLEGESGPIRIFMLQKRGVENLGWGRDRGCSRAAIVADHPTRWIADQSEFIRSQVMQNAALTNASPRLVIVGISEGGDIAPLLGRSLPDISHLAIIGNGGMNPMEALRLRNSLYPDRISDSDLYDFDALNVEPADPDAIDHDIGGRTWRYWSELRLLTPTTDLLGLTVPIWIGMGALDRSIPFETALQVKKQFDLQRKTNLELRIYEGADHGLATSDGSRLADFWYAFDKGMRK